MKPERIQLDLHAPAQNKRLQRIQGGETDALASLRAQAGAGGAPVAPFTAQWVALTASLGVILLDVSTLDGIAAEVPSAGWQSLPLEQIHAMLERVLNGHTPKTDAEPAPRLPLPWPQLQALTPRQQDVLHEAAGGKSNVEIARTLHISEETVKTHMRQILMRLEVRNRTELAAMYQQAVSARER